MSRVDDDRIIARFVAGLEVDERALAEAIAARAIDHAAVVDALVHALADPEPTARLRAAEHVARMDDIDREVADALTRIVVADIDLDVRAAARHALRTHEQPVPDDAVAPAERARPRPSLLFRATFVRSGTSDVAPTLLLPTDLGNTESHGVVTRTEAGWQVEMRGLPAEFGGTRPVLRALSPSGRLVLGMASVPVTPEGAVKIVLSADPGEDARRLKGTVELAVDDD